VQSVHDGEAQLEPRAEVGALEEHAAFPIKVALESWRCETSEGECLDTVLYVFAKAGPV